MLAAAFFLLLLSGGSEEAVFMKRCPSPSSPHDGAVRCSWGRRPLSCRSKLLSGSVAEFSCQKFYELSSDGLMLCRADGSWSGAPPKCIAECGKRRSGLSLAGDAEVPRGAFPWHVAVYSLVEGKYEYRCGGSLISEAGVMTAAHCVWGVPREMLLVVSGKSRREYELVESHSQARRARRIEMPRSYQDVEGNYNGDVAVVFLEEAVKVDEFSAPVCLDWGHLLTGKHLAEGSWGVVPGWGLTEGGVLSDSLRALRLPAVSEGRCIAAQEPNFKKFVTPTTFCAGLGNGAGVCNGDSGGGLAFYEGASGRWYLQGVVSLSPRRKGTPYCDPNFFTIFTKVSSFTKWVEEVGGRKGESSAEVAVYPHTRKMLDLAGFC